MKQSESKISFFICLARILLFTTTGFAFQINCQVTRVLDGDTFHCLPEKAPFGAKVHKDGTISVRMHGIDAPEKRQDYGEDARLSLKEMIGGKAVKLDIKDVDRYGRVVAYVWYNNVNVNLE
ncbi:hypothetical protein TISLANDTSLP1_21660 [Thermodesulfovibrio yellowstonii]|uniref:TNase-like domain-containing protein n=1 Tax=Thermodesulfovibrio yellowstonii TaxID=28262 RepID=A0A9W6GFT2_9BACT|nr:hypothetical protein TISLANDTSLP1_21660 [Thermodesulfovibrio islandicus]